MKIKVKICDSSVTLEKFLNNIDVDDIIQITESRYVIGYTTYVNYTVIYKSRW